MSVPTTPKAPSDAMALRRACSLAVVKDAPLRIVKELLTNTGILQVNGNFEFLDFVANCPSPLPMWTGGCCFRVPPAPPADGEPKPSPALTLSLDKEVRCYNRASSNQPCRFGSNNVRPALTIVRTWTYPLRVRTTSTFVGRRASRSSLLHTPLTTCRQQSSLNNHKSRSSRQFPILLTRPPFPRPRAN